MPTIGVDKYKLFEALGRKYVFPNNASPRICPSSPTIARSFTKINR